MVVSGVRMVSGPADPGAGKKVCPVAIDLLNVILGVANPSVEMQKSAAKVPPFPPRFNRLRVVDFFVPLSPNTPSCHNLLPGE